MENFLDCCGCRYLTIIQMILGAKLTLTGGDFTSLVPKLHRNGVQNGVQKIVFKGVSKEVFQGNLGSLWHKSRRLSQIFLDWGCCSYLHRLLGSEVFLCNKQIPVTHSIILLLVCGDDKE